MHLKMDAPVKLEESVVEALSRSPETTQKAAKGLKRKKITITLVFRTSKYI